MNRLLSLVINETGFAFDPMSGVSYTVNGTGREVIELLRQGQDIEKVVRRISQKYDRPFEDTYTDVLEMVEKLRAYGLV